MSSTVGARLGRPLLGHRRVWIGLITLAVFAVLVWRLWSLQVAASSDYDDLATGNRTRLLTVEGARGRILDAHGRELAVSRSVLALTVDWQQLVDLPDVERGAIWEAAAIELGLAGSPIGPEDLERRYQEVLGRDLRPVEVAADIDPGLWVALSERNLPGIGVEERLVRHYPEGTTAAHVVGYLGTVSGPEEADRLNAELPAGRDRYEPGDPLGRSGIEQRYEAQLRARAEVREVEVDARGRVVRTIKVVQQAEPGDDVRLTIDLDLQRAAEQAIVDGLETAREVVPSCAACPPQRGSAGSIVALRPSDGAVVAMASYPSFDPSWFVGSGDDGVLDEILVDTGQPLLNRAIAGQYPPGSTFKPVTAYASVAAGYRAPSELWTDVGQHRIADCRATRAGDCAFRNAGQVAMGDVDLQAALARSSDTYFYSIGEGLWSEQQRFGRTPIQDVANAWGLGAPTGLDVVGEAAGSVPQPTDGDWYTGDNVNLAIGQGDLLVTPVQLANLYATIASEGRQHEPHLIAGVFDPVTGTRVSDRTDEIATEVVIDRAALDAIHLGLSRATASGTAASAFAGFPLETAPVAGKTGTAQVGGKADYSLFAGYGRTPDIDLAVAAVLEEAGWGATAAAPAVRSVFEAALARSATP